MCLLTNVFHTPCSHYGKRQFIIRCPKSHASGSHSSCNNASCEGIKHVEYACVACKYRTSIKLPATLTTFCGLDDEVRPFDRTCLVQNPANVQKVKGEDDREVDGEVGGEDEDEDEMVTMKRARLARREQMVWVQGKTVSGESELSVERTRTRKRAFIPVHRRKKSKVKISLATIEEENFATDEHSKSGFDGETTAAPESAAKDIPDDIEKWEICTAATVTIGVVFAAMIDIPKPKERKDR